MPPLPVPPNEELSAEGVMRYDAARLFVDRASAVQPSNAPTDDDAGAIARICRRLDGIPLAIELAAFRIAILNPAQIVERLDERFRLLTDGSRLAPCRHQTLQATVDWSYDLLPDVERRLFRRMAVFYGGWTLEAAEHVCADEPIAARDIVDLLGRLVDKSLVVAERRATVRYRMLDTVREYAHARLVEAGRLEATRARHMEWYRDLAERARPELVGSAKVAWFDALEADLDNLRSALAWSGAKGRDGDSALSLTSGLTFL